MSNEVVLPACIPTEARMNLSNPFIPSKNLADISGLTVLLPIDLPIKPANNTFRIWLKDYWKPFLQGFRELISKRFGVPSEYLLELRVLHHYTMNDNGSGNEYVLAFLAQPKDQAYIDSLYILDITSGQVDTMDKNGWKILDILSTMAGKSKL